jgi:cell division protein FtsZ
VIISITGGDDMRLMEVDEAANHIRELVDPDANIIWGSAFNNDLDGKIRVSVVATGIGAEEIMPMPQPAKVFAFPAARTQPTEAPRAEPRRDEPAPITLTPPEGMEPEAETPMTAETTGTETMESAAEPEEMVLDQTMAAGVDEGEDGEELLLDAAEMSEETPAGETADLPPTGTRSWLTQEETPAPAPEPRQAGTLFERMSSIARGAQKAQMPEEQAAEEAPRLRTGTRDPLDIPRFLNRQNNQ